MSIKERVISNPKIKEFALLLITSKQNPRPRLWVRWILNPLIHQKGKGTVIRRHSRIDVFPWNKFTTGHHCTIEDFVTLNNGVGDVIIGNNSRIGMGNTIIGPVNIGNEVIFAQNIVLSGLNHGYMDINIPIRKQPVSKSLITIEDEVWIGANAVVVAGVTIGKHSVIAAGCVVTRDVPPYSVAVGNPCRIIRRYNHETASWEKVTS
ncbi:MAG: acyltransferase [Bacteroidales bacterium]|nr:acyltransferase [Bacteroidales bacterium]MBK9359008.1 acyltransferase [Bacteroidales bacterium]